MDMQSAIRAATEGRDLTGEEMQAVMRTIMSGEATPAQIGGFLVALRMKGETIEEIAAAASVMRELATRVEVSVPNLVDTCGTGGDSLCTFNISTASAFVVAAAGGHVAKHGNRSVYSKSGSADVLEAAGVNLALSPEGIARCIREVGVGFLFAQAHHGAMKHAAPVRQELGVRTLMNVLGPLTNPAGARRQLVGVYSAHLQEPLVRVLALLGAEHVLVVHAEGLDEIALDTSTRVVELKDGRIEGYEITPEDFGIRRRPASELRAESPEASLTLVRHALTAPESAASDIVALNAGAAIYAADVTATLREGVERAREVIAAGRALERFEELIRFTRVMVAS